MVFALAFKKYCDKSVQSAVGKFSGPIHVCKSHAISAQKLSHTDFYTSREKCARSM